MNLNKLSPTEAGVYAAAFGAEFARALAQHQSCHQVMLAGASGDDLLVAYEKRSALELRLAKEDAAYVAEHAVHAFLDTVRPTTSV